MRNKVLLFISQPVYSVLLEQPGQTEKVPISANLKVGLSISTPSAFLIWMWMDFKGRGYTKEGLQHEKGVCVLCQARTVRHPMNVGHVSPQELSRLALTYPGLGLI